MRQVKSLGERLDTFRKKIKRGQGWTINELEVHPEVRGTSARLRHYFIRHGWAIKKMSDTGHIVWLLVNPADLKEHAN